MNNLFNGLDNILDTIEIVRTAKDGKYTAQFTGIKGDEKFPNTLLLTFTLTDEDNFEYTKTIKKYMPTAKWNGNSIDSFIKQYEKIVNKQFKGIKEALTEMAQQPFTAWVVTSSYDGQSYDKNGRAIMKNGKPVTETRTYTDLWFKEPINKEKAAEAIQLTLND